MDSMRTNDISQWENVYLSNKNTFASCNKRNLGVYRCIREEEYETLEKCAEYWIENRSHAAFVHFFIEKGMFPDELFTACLNNYVEDFQKRYNCKIRWTTLLIMKSEYWRSPDIESAKLDFDTEKEIDDTGKEIDKTEKEKKKKKRNDYCYKNDYISKLCRTKDIESIKYKKNAVESYSVPDREIIIQLGMYLNLSSADVNSLFCAAGLPQFYVLDIIDTVSMYYLDKYHEEGIKIPERWEEEGRKRIRNVKDKINEILHTMLDENNEEVIKTKMYPVVIEKKDEEEKEKPKDKKKKRQKKEIHPYRKITYKHSLCDTVDEEIQKFMEEIEPENETEGVEGNTFYITKKMKIFYQRNKTEDFDEVKNNVILQKDKDQKYISALEYRYGYIRKIKTVLKKAMKKGNYRKNFENLDWDFDITKPWQYKLTEKSQNKNDEFKAEEPELTALDLKTDLLKIWYCDNFIDRVVVPCTTDPKSRIMGPENSMIGPSWSRSCIDNYIHHRTVSLKTKSKINSEEISESVKIPQTMSKCTLTKFIILMGIEDKRNVYFESAGYGIERNYYKGKQKMKTEKNSYPVDRGDMLFEYVCILRDKLIERYLKKADGKDSSILRNDLSRSFPFAKMMNYVTRDILYVIEFLAGESLMKTEKERAEIEAEEKLKIQKDRLKNPKNSGYCLCFPYLLESCGLYVGGDK